MPVGVEEAGDVVNTVVSGTQRFSFVGAADRYSGEMQTIG
jgi:hypothetical protein